MINMLVGFLALLVISFILLIVLAPVRLGEFFYKYATHLEARIYGLSKYQLSIGEMNISLFKNSFKPRPTILMLHGFSADKNVWVRFARYFSGEFNLIIPDLAGHGETGFDANWSYSGPHQVERLIKLLDELHIEKVHVIGNSMGGFISAHFAIMYPERTSSSTLVDPAGVRSPQKSDMDKMLSNGRNPFEIHNQREFDEFYAMTMAKPPLVPGFILQYVSETYQQRKEQLTQIIADFYLQDMLDSRLDQFNVPVLVMWGTKDRLIHVSSADVWVDGIKGAQLKIWPEVGHMPMLEVPKESSVEYSRFLRELD